MSLGDLGLIGVREKTLLIDGDIVIYQPCCIFNEDDDQSRNQIKKHISNKIDKMMIDADCMKYIMFVTTKFNFRDALVDDYKANRTDVERPVNLAWAKRWCVNKLNNHYHKGLEADDLLGIYNGKDTVIWSLDKDLRQLPGEHLDDETGKVITVTEEGRLDLKKWVTEEGNAKEKIYFDGTIGLYYQMLIGDSTDYILGCGIREERTYKTGAKKGENYIARKGVGPKAALSKLTTAIMRRGSKTMLEAGLDCVKAEYYKVHGKDWQKHLETQANLLYMVRLQRGEIIRRWTYDGRKEYFHLVEGRILSEKVFLNDYANSTT